MKKFPAEYSGLCPIESPVHSPFDSGEADVGGGRAWIHGCGGPAVPLLCVAGAGAAKLSSSGGPRPTFARPLTRDLLPPLCALLALGRRYSQALSIS